MKKSPDIVSVIVLFFVVGTLITGLTQSDFGFISLVNAAGH